MKKYLITEKQLNCLLEQTINGISIRNSDIIYQNNENDIKRLFSRWFPIYFIELKNGQHGFMGVSKANRNNFDVVIITSAGKKEGKYVMDMLDYSVVGSLEYIEGNVTLYINPSFHNANVERKLIDYTNKHMGIYSDAKDLDIEELEG